MLTRQSPRHLVAPTSYRPGPPALDRSKSAPSGRFMPVHDARSSASPRVVSRPRPPRRGCRSPSPRPPRRRRRSTPNGILTIHRKRQRLVQLVSPSAGWGRIEVAKPTRLALRSCGPGRWRLSARERRGALPRRADRDLGRTEGDDGGRGVRCRTCFACADMLEDVMPGLPAPRHLSRHCWS